MLRFPPVSPPREIKPPAGTAQIDWSKPVAADLRTAHLFGGHTARDIVLGEVGTWEAGVASQAAEPGHVLQFDGTNGVTGPSTNYDTLSQTNYTIAVRFKQTTAGTSQDHQSIWTKGNHSAYLSLGQAGPYAAYYDAAGWHIATITHTLNVWHTLVAVRRGVAVKELWIDGQIVGNFTGLAVATTWAATGNLAIGRRNDGAAAGSQFNGQAAWALVWNRSLPENDIRALSEHGLNAVLWLPSILIPISIGAGTSATITAPAAQLTLNALAPVVSITEGPPLLISPVSGTVPSPVTFVWQSRIDSLSRPVHFRINTAASPATVNGDGSLDSALIDVHSMSTSGFEYDTSAGSDGTGPWVAVPAGGLTAANQSRQVRYQSAAAAGATDWRIRQDPVITT